MIPRKHLKTAAAILVAVAVAGVAVLLVNRDKTSSAPEVAKKMPATSARRADATTSSSNLKVMSLEDWNQKIAGTDISEFRDLIDQATNITDADLRNSVVVSILDRWMKENATSFISYLSSLEVYGKNANLAIVAQALQGSMTKLSPELAASDDILVIVQRLITYLAGHDPEAALAWSKRFLLDDTKDQALVAVARGFAENDVKKALDIIGSMTSPLRRGQALAQVGGVWAQREPEAALAWAMALPVHGERALALNQVLMVVAANGNVSSAAAQLLRQSNLINEQYKQARTADLAARGISEADLANDPAVYKEMAEAGTLSPPGSPDVEMLELAGRAIGIRMGEKDGPGAAEWSKSIDNTYLRLKSVAGVLEGWAKNDPGAAISYANANYPNDSNLLTSIFSSWASINGEAAAVGTSMIADPNLRSLALEAAVTSWSAKGQPAAVADFLGTLPASEVSDGTKIALVAAMSQTAPEKAWTLAQSIGDESTQFRALKNAFSHLVIESPVQAEALLASSNLSNDTSGRLQDMLDAVVGK